MICGNCKRNVPEQAAYCPYCGAALSAAVAAKRKRKSKKGLAVLPVCLLLCLVAFVAFWFLDEQDVQAQSYIGTEKGTALTDEEAERILLSDISDEDWEIFESANAELSQIIAAYSDEDGYVDPDDAEAALNAVAEQVDALYEDGTVTYYLCTSDTVSFEFASGLGALYTPSLEGYAAGGGDTTILAFDVFSDEEFQGDGKNWLGEYGGKEEGSTYFQTAGRLASELQEAISGSYVYTWVGAAADLDALCDLPEADILLWNGHGQFHKNAYPVLATLDEVTSTEIMYDYFVVRDCVYTEGNPGYWAITPSFVRKHISMDQGLVYLGTCYSGRNDELANAFLYSGAEVVFVHAGDRVTQAFYSQWMMKTIMEYMSGEYDGIYHTAAESMFLANGILSNFCSGINGVDTLTLWNAIVDREWFSSDYGSFSSLDEFLQNVNGGSHVEYRGNGDYTLCPCIRGEVTFAEGMTEAEINEVLSSGLTVQLTKEDGSSLVTVDVNEDGTFYFNDLEPGTTYVVSSLEIAEQSVTVSVKAHRYTEVSLEYSRLVTLEGYVYDTDGAPLSGVTVSAEDATGGSGLRSAETRTDDNGYYALKVYGENTYALTYSKSGYTEQETTFQITPELFEQAQEGTPCTLEDVELTADTWLLTSLVQTDPDGAEVYRLTLTYDSEGRLQTQKQTWENGGEYAYTFSYAEGSDLIESCTLDILVKDEDGTYDSYDLYGEYFYDGKDLSVWWLNRDGDGWGREISIYDSTGEIVEELLFDGFGGYFIINAECDDYGKVLRYDVVYILEYYTGPYYAYSYEYNEQGDWIVKTKYDEDGNLLQTQTASYTYDENGNKAVGAFYRDGAISNYVTYTYSKS